MEGKASPQVVSIANIRLARRSICIFQSPMPHSNSSVQFFNEKTLFVETFDEIYLDLYVDWSFTSKS